ncbi:hypothetical protein YQE_05326, partial [Dendroctonus ponderosae]
MLFRDNFDGPRGNQRSYEGSYRDDPYDNYYDTYERYNKPLVEKYYNFHEEFPSWMPRMDYWEPIPSLKFVRILQCNLELILLFAKHLKSGINKFPIGGLLEHVSSLDGMEVIITATVGDRFLDEVIEGYSSARISNSTVKLKFLGDSPQVFKPGMPVTTYLVASFHDGSPLSQASLQSSFMEVTAYVERQGGGRSEIAPKRLYQMDEKPGVWEYQIDLKRELGLYGPRAFEELSQLNILRIQATFRDDYTNQHANAELLMQAHYSHNDQHVKVTTSTITPQVDRLEAIDKVK